jgi:hypothetical protein
MVIMIWVYVCLLPLIFGSIALPRARCTQFWFTLDPQSSNYCLVQWTTKHSYHSLICSVCYIWKFKPALQKREGAAVRSGINGPIVAGLGYRLLCGESLNSRRHFDREDWIGLPSSPNNLRNECSTFTRLYLHSMDRAGMGCELEIVRL